MGKTSRILQLINLLVSRETVTLDNIRSTCQVPTRTVYRYLNWISEANIPVYYDKEAQAYRLSRSLRITVDDISLHDSVVLMTCLKLMAAHVNEEYRQDIDRLITKLLVRQKVSLDGDFVQALGATGSGRMPDYSETLATSLVTAAVATGRPVRLYIRGDDGGTRTEEIAMPRLHFAGGWSVGDADPGNERPNHMSTISKIDLL